MATRQEIEQQLKLLPPPPFYARLTSPRLHLTQRQLLDSPFVAPSGERVPLFAVVEVVIDRCFEQPGAWVRAVDTQPRRFRDGQYRKPQPDIWLNLEWCITYGYEPLTPFCLN